MLVCNGNSGGCLMFEHCKHPTIFGVAVVIIVVVSQFYLTLLFIEFHLKCFKQMRET